MSGTTDKIESIEQFDKDATGLQNLWQIEIEAALREVKKWHNQGEKIIKRFLDERTTQSSKNGQRLNLFTANIQTMRALLYGNVPNVDVKRRFDDANDDAARVAGEMLDRILNTDIEDNGESYDEALVYGLDDRLLPGMGVARVRYEADFEEQVIPAVLDLEGNEVAPEVKREIKTHEDAVIDYVNWRDFIWSPARTWGEVRWIAYRAYMKRDDAIERFGEDKARQIAYKDSRRKSGTVVDQMQADPWQRGEVWEIWSKEINKVFWYSDGCTEILDVKDDPLELEDFFPSPRPMFANITTSSLVPRPDYVLAQDQYSEIDSLTTRINLLQSAVKAVGVYDKEATGVKRMMEEGVENDLIPVDNWAMFAEKGGIRGTVDWMPIQDIVAAMDKLREYRNEVIQLTYQVTGMSDIMRGASNAGGSATATEQSIKARFASVRTQSLQDNFARFATDLQRIKAEIICKHFDDGTIVARANMQFSPDMQLIPQALQVLRDRFREYRIMIISDQMALTDYAALKSEKVDYLNSLSTFLGAAMPMTQQVPGSTPFLLEMLKWGMTGFKGSNSIEGVLDQAIAEARKSLEQPQGEEQDPEVQKQQMEMQREQMKLQAEMQKIHAKANADMQKLYQQTQADLAKLQAKTQGALLEEEAQAHYGIIEKRATGM
jgi:hypothetical protein